MNTRALYHEGSRQLQDRFDSRRLADRLEQVTVHAVFDDDDRAFIGKAAQFFLATADAEGRPDCSYKGGMPGFVRILDDSTLAFPDYDGNGKFRSLGNIMVTRTSACSSSTFRRATACASTAQRKSGLTIRC